MKTKWIVAILLMFLTLTGPLYAGSVYRWTDENGVRHFSNTSPPEQVVDAEVQPEEVSPSVDAASSDETDTDENAPPAGPQEGETADVAPEAGGEKAFEDRLAAEAENERQRLEAEIKRIKGLAIGKSFTQGMKDAQIRPLQEQLALLSADPKRYFRMKREGAFKSTYPDESAENAAAPSSPLGGSLSSEPATSSADGSSGKDTPSPKETNEEKPSDEAQSDAKKSGKSRSGGSGAASLFPEN